MSIHLDREMIDRQAVRQFAERVGRVDVAEQMLTMFLAEARGHLQDFYRHLESGDHTKLRSVLHSLKGGAGNAGVTGIANLCTRIREMGNAEMADKGHLLHAALQRAIERAERETRSVVQDLAISPGA